MRKYKNQYSIHSNIKDFINHSNNNYVTKNPLCNLVESEQQFTITIAAPGLEKKDFDIRIEEDQITISSHKSENTRNTLRREEFNYAVFKRKITLPKNIDRENIKASYSLGVLILTLPKQEAIIFNSKIEIQ